MKFLIALLFVSSCAFAEVNFSEEQLDNLNYAYQFGEQYNKNGTLKNPEDRYNDEGLGYIFAAIAWQESSALEDPRKIRHRKNHHAYGMFQNYLITVRNRLKQQGEYKTDEEIIGCLVKRECGSTWSYIELENWLKVHKGDLSKALASYNAGYNWRSPAGQQYKGWILGKAQYLKDHKIVYSPTE